MGRNRGWPTTSNNERPSPLVDASRQA
jgi:hypothetical protein